MFDVFLGVVSMVLRIKMKDRYFDINRKLRRVCHRKIGWRCLCCFPAWAEKRASCNQEVTHCLHC